MPCLLASQLGLLPHTRTTVHERLISLSNDPAGRHSLQLFQDGRPKNISQRAQKYGVLAENKNDDEKERKSSKRQERRQGPPYATGVFHFSL